ncbi:hypothetical protein C2W62_23535 [Candidatus Entotheonella serta]|nr:hypothetical protein C2W62_23535 [Candidatus Entotheonella serta]
MKACTYSMPEACSETSSRVETVQVEVAAMHPLLLLKQALPWEAITETMTRHWRECGKNVDGGPGLPWDVSLYVPLLVLMLKTGEADVISVSRERAPEVKSAGMNVFTKSRWSILGVYFHEQWRTEVPIFKLEVRQALSHAINREELAQYVFAGSAVPASVFPMPSRTPGAVPDLKPHEYDPDKAKALLKEAGYPNGFEVTVYSFPRADVPEMVRFIEAMAGYFSEIGVKAKIIPTEYASYRKKRLGFDLPGALGALAAPNRPLAAMVSLMRLLVHSEGRFTSVKDPALDKLIVKAEEAATDADAEAALQEIYRYMYDNVNHLTVVEMDLPYATSAEIKDWDLGGAVWDQNFTALIRQ